MKCLLSDLEHCTFCSVLDNRILARGFRGDHPQMSLQTYHKRHFRRPTLTPHRRIHSVFIRSWIHLSISQLAQHARHEIRSAGFTSSQNSAHRNLRSHLLLSQIKPQKSRNSDSIRVSENDFDAHFHDRHQRRDCRWEERKTDRSSERERLAIDHRRRRRRTTLHRVPAFHSVCV